MKILIAIYSPPEHYPPLLNAIRELSEFAEELFVVTRNIKVQPWSYPSNVNISRVGPELEIKEFMTMSYARKLSCFRDFVEQLRLISKNAKPEVWMANDSIPLLAFHILLKSRQKKPRIYWYHSHDVCDIDAYTFLSVGWWSAKLERKAMKMLDLFSLPSAERLKYYEYGRKSLKTVVVPNYPSGRYFSKFRGAKTWAGDTIRMIYQGSLSQNHGFEELIPLLNEKIGGRPLFLTLIGPIDEQYKKELMNLALANSVQDNMVVLAPVPYAELGEITVSHQIGLAIHKPVGFIYNTAGTASNKIYEYAALGLPVILYDDPHYRQYLSGYSWTGFTDCSKSSILKVLAELTEGLEDLSVSAKRDFTEKLNFEIAFAGIKEFMKS